PSVALRSLHRLAEGGELLQVAGPVFYWFFLSVRTSVRATATGWFWGWGERLPDEVEGVPQFGLAARGVHRRRRLARGVRARQVAQDQVRVRDQVGGRGGLGPATVGAGLGQVILPGQFEGGLEPALQVWPLPTGREQCHRPPGGEPGRAAWGAAEQV